MDRIQFITVSRLNQYISGMFEANLYLENVYLKGEISNFKISGKHYYFSLKDETSEISAIMFYPYNTTLKFTPVDGMSVQVTGKIQVYQKKGSYAIYIRKMDQDGVGLLYQEYLELKEKLSKEGLFDDKYKKPIPNYPNIVAIITSPTGDAIHDIISTFNRRLPLAKLILYPALVQGKDAAADLTRALKRVYSDGLADVLIIGRGGGSFEDLACFNDETLARTLFSSPIPTVTGIGHEADFTICDFVSSYRAPTPTGAAMRLTREKSECLNDVYKKAFSLKNNIINCLKNSFNKYQKLLDSYGLAHFDKLLKQKSDHVLILTSGLNEHSPKKFLELKTQRILELENKVQNLSTYNLNNRSKMFELNVEKLKPALIQARISNYREIIEYNISNLNNHLANYLYNKEQNVENMIKKIVLLNPFNTMERGYAIIYQNDKIQTSIDPLSIDDKIIIEMADGRLDALVLNKSTRSRGK